MWTVITIVSVILAARIGSAAAEECSYDIVRQSVVILMGGLARHLDKEDPKVKPIIGKLIAALATPSQQVQVAVANCLPPLGN